MKFLITLLSFIYMASVNAQEINSHQWKDRLLLILSKNSENENFQDQVRILKENHKDLEERKLVVYQILPGKFKTGINEDAKWQQSEYLFKKYKTPNSNFDIILIGLDGREKFKDSKVVPVQTIFSTIDSMPMRKAEIRKKGND